MQPIELNKRIDELDYIRGFALIGIMLVNILPLLMVKLPAANTIDASYQRFLYLFVEGRFYTIFSFLFGVGFYLFISRANTKGHNGYRLFLRRIIALYLIGIVHAFFHPGEALAIYAFCGLVVLPFYRVKKEINLIVGIILLSVFAFLGVKIMMPLPLILLGLAAGQYQIFEHIHKKRKQLIIFTVIFAVLTIAGLAYQYTLAPAAPFAPIIIGGVDDPQLEQANQFMLVGIMIGPIISAFYVGMLLLLLQIPVMQRLLSPFKYYGRMALTNYLGQTLFILLLGKWFGLVEEMTMLQSLRFCIVIYVIQLTFSRIWLHFFRYGPVEWIWRMITYFEMPVLLQKRKS